MYIRVHSRDNVAILVAPEGAKAGAELPGGLIVRERIPQSHKIALQDLAVGEPVLRYGQTIGLAGLITDSATRGNSGIPWLKDIPLLGLLAGTQDNQRTRTELLVLITPHVLHDQRDARALTLDLQQQLPAAAAVPAELQHLRASGSNDPEAGLRHRLEQRLQQ